MRIQVSWILIPVFISCFLFVRYQIDTQYKEKIGNQTIALVLSTSEDNFQREWAFYTEVLGFQESNHETLAMGNSRIVINRLEAGQVVEMDISAPMFVLEVEDLLLISFKLIEFGIAFPDGIKSSQYGRYLIFKDPAGNSVKLIQ